MKSFSTPQKIWTVGSFDNLSEYTDLVNNNELRMPGARPYTVGSRYVCAAIGQRMCGAQGDDRIYIDISADQIANLASQNIANLRHMRFAKDVSNKLYSSIYPQYGREARLLVNRDLFKKFYSDFDELALTILYPSDTRPSIWVDPNTLDTHDTFWFAKTAPDILELDSGMRMVTPIRLTIAKILQGRSAGSVFIQTTDTPNSPLEISESFNSDASLNALIDNVCSIYPKVVNLKTILDDLKPFLLSLL